MAIGSGLGDSSLTNVGTTAEGGINSLLRGVIKGEDLLEEDRSMVIISCCLLACELLDKIFGDALLLLLLLLALLLLLLFVLLFVLLLLLLLLFCCSDLGDKLLDCCRGDIVEKDWVRFVPPVGFAAFLGVEEGLDMFDRIVGEEGMEIEGTSPYSEWLCSEGAGKAIAVGGLFFGGELLPCGGKRIFLIIVTHSSFSAESLH